MPTVLLVDDSPAARHAIAKRLQAAGFDVHEVGSATDARTLDLDPFACAVVDVELADGDGPSLAVELHAKRPELPVAFFTSSSSPDVHERAHGQGPVFTKPNLDPLLAWAKRESYSTQPPPTK
jgi:two-component system cell cycle sensor histidine kinase/response regulator CckA